MVSHKPKGSASTTDATGKSMLMVSGTAAAVVVVVVVVAPLESAMISIALL
jgi:hypothetical protein